MVYSYDIFDTLIVRKVGQPTAIFNIIEEEILSGRTSIEKSKGLYFAQKRIESEHISREISNQEHGHYEVLLDDIYRVLQEMLYFSSDEIVILKALEISTEMKYIVGIEKNINKIKNHISNNEKVILISDMYLPKECIKLILENIDKIFEHDDIKIYVSGEIGKSKHVGNLYEYIKRDLNLNYKEWFHVGDNYNSDIAKPKGKGIKTDYFYHGRLNESERFLASHDFYKIKKLLLTQFIYGSSRLTRLKYNYSEASKPYETLGASFVGPLLYSFCTWLVQMALADSKFKLYFCSRDGYLLKQVSDIIIEKKKLPLSTFYFYTSRASMIPISLTLPLNEKQMMFAIRNTYTEPLKDFFKSLSLTDTEINNLIDQKNIDKYTRNLSNEDLLSALTKSLNLYNDKITSYIAEQQNLFTRYIEQEGYDENSAFVDVGWSGTLQNIISSYMHRTNKNFTTSGYYLSLSNGLSDSFNVKKAYLYLREHDLSSTPNILECLIEAILPAPHNGVLRYKEHDNTIDAVLNEGINPYDLWPADKLIEGVNNYTITASMNIDSDCLKNLEQLRFLGKYMLLKFMNPTKLITYTISRIKYTSKLDHEALRDLAPEFTFKTLKIFEKNRKLYGDWTATYMYTFWKEGSLKRSKEIIQILFHYNNSKFFYKMAIKNLIRKILNRIQHGS